MDDSRPSDCFLIFVSPDESLRLLVIKDGDDVSLGFEGHEWHTHADLLLAEYGTDSAEIATGRFIQDVVTGCRPIVVRRKGGTIVDISIDYPPDSPFYRDPLDDPYLESDETIEIRRWTS